MSESVLPTTSSQTQQANPWTFVSDSPNSRVAVTERVDYQLVHARMGVLTGLYVALRAKHGPAASHSLRVALWASAWGIHSQVKEEHLQLFETVGLMHEIGKIGIPDRVLQKADLLNEHERAMLDLHSQVGLEILRAAGASKELLLSIEGIGASFVSTHQEHCLEIAPVASRLINIIDTYDSLITNHAHHDVISRENALAELLRLGGTQFDPRLVRTFADLVLHPRPAIYEQVKERWLSHLETIDHRQLFDINHPPLANRGEKIGSTLIHSLNDTFYRHMMDNLQDGVIFIDSEFRVLDWNDSAERMTGKSADSVYHRHWSPSLALLCDSDGFVLTEAQCPFAELMQTGDRIKQRLTIRREDQPLLHVNVEVVPVLNDFGHLCGGTMILEDISETAKLEQKIMHLRERACQDQLTKVANRGELDRQLPEFVAHHQRTGQAGSVVICDIDFFKRINDNFSHQAGDEALILFANILKESCRETDFVARYGGEEFVLLCSRCDFSAAKEWAESIRRRLQRTPIPVLRNACITASFGVSTVLAGDTAESVLNRADQGLLIAKESGRDRVVGIGEETTSNESKNDSREASWLGWLTSSSEPLYTFELLTNVPRNVTLEKLKGFVNDYHATVVQVEQSKVILDVDCRKTPIPQASNERLGKFQIKIQIVELEMKSGSRNENLNLCTLLETQIIPLRTRDRRSDAVKSQVLRLKTSLQGFMVAREMTDELRADVIRRVKPEKDSRY